MTSDLPDRMPGAHAPLNGGRPNRRSDGRTPGGVDQQRSNYGAGLGARHNPYAVGGPDPTTTTGATAPPPDAGATARPPDAGAHYLPGSPATAHLGSDGGRKRGLLALVALLVLGSFAYLVWHAVTWLDPLVAAAQQCPVERGVACFTGTPFQQWVYAPVLGVLLAWAFASGAATEGRQGRARGYLHLLAGVAALVISGLVSAL